MILKVENEKTKGFVYYDIGNGRVEKNPYEWVVRKKDEYDNFGIDKVIWDEEGQQCEIRTDINHVINDDVDILYDFSKWEKHSYKVGDYSALSQLLICVNTVKQITHTVFIPYSSNAYLLNNEGRTIERL